MSFGFSASDVVLLVQLAWTTVRNSRKACGEYAELTRETTSLHVNLRRLEREIAKPESPINRPSDTCRQDLAPIVDGCRKALDVLDRILEKYNALSDEERSKGKLSRWKAVRFGNGELANVGDLRLKLTYYTSNLSLFLNMVSMGSMGIVEKQMYEAGGDLKDIRRAVNGITAHLMSGATKEGSVLTDYAGDDKAVWRAFRRELVKGGFSSDVIREHKDTIQAYVQELGSRGILDDEDLEDSGNISEEIEDTAPAQATPQSQDEAMGSFESKSGAARDAVSPHTARTKYFDGSSGTVNRDPREDQTFPQQTQTAAIPLTMNIVSDTLPFIAQADVEINSVMEGDSKEDDKSDDGTNRCRSLTPISLAQNPTELAEEDTWCLGQINFIRAFWYHNDCYHDAKYFELILVNEHEAFEFLSNPLVARRETLEFQDGAKGFLKVAEVRTRLGNRGSKSKRGSLLRLSSLFHTDDFYLGENIVAHTIHYRHPGTVISHFLQYGLRKIDARREKWRITKWPLPSEKTKAEGHGGGKGKRSTVPPHAAPENTQDPSSTTEKVKTKEDDDFERAGNDSTTRQRTGIWRHW